MMKSTLETDLLSVRHCPLGRPVDDVLLWVNNKHLSHMGRWCMFLILIIGCQSYWMRPFNSKRKFQQTTYYYDLVSRLLSGLSHYIFKSFCTWVLSWNLRLVFGWCVGWCVGLVWSFDQTSRSHFKRNRR